MPRRPREDFPNSIHHVIQRGNNRNYIYENIQDKQEFLQILTTALHLYEARLLHYVLMDNHYHLLIQVKDQPLAQLLWYINRNYTLYYNQRYHRIGTIYGGRYKSYLITEPHKFFSTVRYIVRNPLKAGLVDSLLRYRWSGHEAVLQGASRLIDRKALLLHFSPDSTIALKRYKECTEHDSWSQETGFTAGDDTDNELEERISCLLDRFLSEHSAQHYRNILVSGSRDLRIRELRNTFIKTAILDGYALKHIANFLHISHETVRRVGKEICDN